MPYHIISYHRIHIWLVVSTPLKNMKVSWDDYSQYMEKNGPNHQPDIYTLASLPLRHQSSGPRADVLLAARLGSYCDPHNGRGTVPAAAKPCQWGTCQKQQQWSPVWEYKGPALSQISNKYEDSNHLQLAKKKRV